jgi:SAM-dependent methyltransferase
MSTATVHRPACPACARGETDILIPRLDFSDATFRAYFEAFYPESVAAWLRRLGLPPGELRFCPHCGTIFHGIIPSPPALAGFYSELQTATIATTAPIDTYREEQRFNELMMVVRFLQPEVPRPHVLDFGTGDGSWARLAAAAGCQVTATDTAENAFPALRACGISCLQAGTLPETAFDFINSEQVFEHLPDPVAVVTMLATALKPGGILKIGVPCDPDLAAKLRTPDWCAAKDSPRSLNAVAPIEHLNAFSPAGLEHLAGLAGLIPLHVSGFTLHDPRHPWRPGLRGRLVRRLRDRLGQRHRPPYALAQTRFFLRPD